MDIPTKNLLPHNPLSALERLIDFGMFRPVTEGTLLKKDRKSNAWRKAIGSVLMFMVLFRTDLFLFRLMKLYA